MFVKRTLAAAAGSALIAVVGLAPAQAAPAAPAQAAPVVASASVTATGATYQVDGLSPAVVSGFDKYVKTTKSGRFVAEIPAGVALRDPKGARATREAVRTANRVLASQGVTSSSQMTSRGANGTTTQGKKGYGPVRPLGEHATFQAAWWGMTFTLDSVAAGKLADAINGGKKVSDVLTKILDPALAIDPIVGAAVRGTLEFLFTLGDRALENITEDGLVIKSLYLPITWTEKPTGPFVPAPVPAAA